jgi:F-type H+-transporting ATPase subunit b
MTALVRAAACAAAVLFLPASAPAADAAAGQKSVLEPNLVNSIVTLVVFGALLAILYAAAWGPIMKGLAAREAAQFEAVEEAKKAREEAAAMRANLEAEMAKAADQVRALIAEARRDADALRATEREAGVREAAAERERAKREIDAAKDAALNDIYKQAVDLATLLSAKTLSRQISAEDHSRLVDESLAELKQAAKTA